MFTLLQYPGKITIHLDGELLCYKQEALLQVLEPTEEDEELDWFIDNIPTALNESGSLEMISQRPLLQVQFTVDKTGKTYTSTAYPHQIQFANGYTSLWLGGDSELSGYDSKAKE